MKVLLVVPAFNEEDSLPNLIGELRQFYNRYDVIVVDDASTDRTISAARSCGASVLCLPANLGIGGAVQTGFKYAVRNNYDIVVQVDGDGQHNPAFIESMLEPIKKGTADCVIGSRYTKETPDTNYHTPFPRRIGMFFSTGLLRLFTGVVVTDTTSGLRALNSRAVEFFAKEYPVDHPEAEALLMLIKKGYRLMEIPVKMRNREAGKSLFTFFRSAIYPFRVLVGFLGFMLRNTRE
jgi:glycosyltransferase involved in cell wall biosynthesis